MAVHCLPQSFVFASMPLLRPIAVRDRLLDRGHFSSLIIEAYGASGPGLSPISGKNIEWSSSAPVVSRTLQDHGVSISGV